MPVVWIPSLLRGLCGGQRQVRVAGATLREVIEALEAACPGVRERLLDGDRLRPELQLSVDGQVATLGLRQPVREESEVHILPAVGGGAG